MHLGQCLAKLGNDDGGDGEAMTLVGSFDPGVKCPSPHVLHKHEQVVHLVGAEDEPWQMGKAPALLLGVVEELVSPPSDTFVSATRKGLANIRF